jgi:hypothetical protein
VIRTCSSPCPTRWGSSSPDYSHPLTQLGYGDVDGRAARVSAGEARTSPYPGHEPSLIFSHPRHDQMQNLPRRGVGHRSCYDVAYLQQVVQVWPAR